MIVSEMIELLSQMNPDAEVRLAHQPTWPLEYSVAEVVERETPQIMTKATFEALDEGQQEQVLNRADEGEVVLVDEGEPEPAPLVFIAEGRQLGYLTEGMSRQLGWR